MRSKVFWPSLVAVTLAVITSPANAGSGNPSQDWLMKISAGSRALVLGLAVSNGCAGSLRSSWAWTGTRTRSGMFVTRNGDSNIVRVAQGRPSVGTSTKRRWDS